MDSDLTRKAIEELVREMHERQQLDNQKPQERKVNPLGKPNKQFLGRTINSALTHNKRQTQQTKRNCQRKLREMDEAHCSSGHGKKREASEGQSSSQERSSDHKEQQQHVRKRKMLKKRKMQKRRGEPSDSSTSSSSADEGNEQRRRQRKRQLTDYAQEANEMNVGDSMVAAVATQAYAAYSTAASNMAMIAANHMQSQFMRSVGQFGGEAGNGNAIREILPAAEDDEEMDPVLRSHLRDTSSPASANADDHERIVISSTNSDITASSDASSASTATTGSTSSPAIINCVTSTASSNSSSSDNDDDDDDNNDDGQARAQLAARSRRNIRRPFIIHVSDSPESSLSLASTLLSSHSNSPLPGSAVIRIPNSVPGPSGAAANPEYASIQEIIRIDLSSSTDTEPDDAADPVLLSTAIDEQEELQRLDEMCASAGQPEWLPIESLNVAGHLESIPLDNLAEIEQQESIPDENLTEAKEEEQQEAIAVDNLTATEPENTLPVDRSDDSEEKASQQPETIPVDNLDRTDEQESMTVDAAGNGDDQATESVDNLAGNEQQEMNAVDNLASIDQQESMRAENLTSTEQQESMPVDSLIENEEKETNSMIVASEVPSESMQIINLTEDEQAQCMAIENLAETKALGDSTTAEQDAVENTKITDSTEKQESLPIDSLTETGKEEANPNENKLSDNLAPDEQQESKTLDNVDNPLDIKVSTEQQEPMSVNLAESQNLESNLPIAVEQETNSTGTDKQEEIDNSKQPIETSLEPMTNGKDKNKNEMDTKQNGIDSEQASKMQPAAVVPKDEQ